MRPSLLLLVSLAAAAGLRGAMGEVRLLAATAAVFLCVITQLIPPTLPFPRRRCLQTTSYIVPAFKDPPQVRVLTSGSGWTAMYVYVCLNAASRPSPRRMCSPSNESK